MEVGQDVKSRWQTERFDSVRVAVASDIYHTIPSTAHDTILQREGNVIKL